MNNLNTIIEQGITTRNILRRNIKRNTNAVANSYRKIVDLLNENNELKNSFTVRDISQFFNPLIPFEKSIFRLTKEEFADRLKKEIDTALTLFQSINITVMPQDLVTYVKIQFTEYQKIQKLLQK